MKELYYIISMKFKNPFARKTLSVKSPHLQNRMLNLQQIGFEPKCVIDAGAHKGNWTKLMNEFFPEAHFTLFEPNPMVNQFVEENLRHIPDNYVLEKKAVGASKGSMQLNVWENNDKNLSGSSLLDHVRGEGTKQVDCEIIDLDGYCKEKGLNPDLIKLDLQGYEVEALKGCKELLGKVELFIIEFGCLDAYVGRSGIDDLIAVMYQHDYKLYDIIDLHYRPYDQALTGGDFFFVHKSSSLLAYKGYE